MGKLLQLAFAEDLKPISDFNAEFGVCIDSILWDCSDICVLGGASSSAHWHPKEMDGPFGLIKHSKAVLFLVKEMIKCDKFYDHQPVITYALQAAAIIHDLDKYTEPETLKQSNKHHAWLMRNRLARLTSPNQETLDLLRNTTQYVYSHMARWNTSMYYKGDEQIQIETPVPLTREEWLLAWADKIASIPILHFEEFTKFVISKEE